MALLGDPQHDVPVIHITGTNGKGTVAAMITSLLVAHGLSVGTYTSPDLERVNERLARIGREYRGTSRVRHIATLVRDKLKALKLRYPPDDPRLKGLVVQ